MKRAKRGWGFDTKGMDQRVRPQDDFYQFANGGWLAKNRIPPSEARWGSFIILRYKTERELRGIVSGLASTRHPKGTPEQLVADLYRSATDIPLRNALGAKPINPWRERVDDLQSMDEFFDLLADFHRIGIDALWHAYVDQDSKQSSRYLLHLSQGGLGMPEREYYLHEGAEQKRVKKAYRAYMESVLSLTGYDEKVIPKCIESVMRVETMLARASMRKEDTRDTSKTYHKRSLGALARETPTIPWQRYLKHIGAVGVRELIVGQPLFFKKLSEALESVSLVDWKRYLAWRLLDDAGSLLSLPFVHASFAWSGKTLAGSNKLKPLWRRGLSALSGSIPEALGKLYVKRYFSHEAKRKMDELVNDLFNAYEKRIQNLDWMGAATKRRAVAKLRTMSRKIGAPERFEAYRGLRILPNDYFGNMVRASEFEHRKNMRKLQKKRVDRLEWFMSPQTVNAYYSYNLNDIVFPAAILQPPFFDADADAALNYGAIGSVIGHEMTHGFDDQGSKFDGTGNMKNWWTALDRKRFEKKATSLVTQYNRYLVEGGVSINGKLTLGENIADLGGVVIAFDAYQRHLETHGRKTLGGFSPEERFFLGYAQIERELVRPEFAKTHALTDPHSPGQHRVNGPLENVTAFHEVFRVGSGDRMYRKPKDRCEIW